MIYGRRTGSTMGMHGRASTRQPGTLPRILKWIVNGSLQFLNGDVAEKVAEIKTQPGSALHIWGSSNRLQTLFKHDWVDALWLMVYPLTVGAGKRLFADGTLPAAFKVTESHVSSKGMVAVNYERVSGN